MSVVYCPEHGNIDTDFHSDHFDDNEQCLDACTHENVTTEVSYDSKLDRDVTEKVCENCSKVMDDEDLFIMNRHL